jgi:glycerol-3-phosphate dehydrogenase
MLVVGGGVNGAGIARDAAGRGHKVLLVERGDLAQATSSASSKLIHGGLRYLENYQFRLVREALAEREVLLRMAPHIIWPLRFVLPHRPQMRPRWMIRAGLFLYDHLARREMLSGSETIDLRHHRAGQGPAQHAHHAGVRHAGAHLVQAQGAQVLGNDAGGAELAVAQFRVGVDISAQLREGAEVFQAVE